MDKDGYGLVQPSAYKQGHKCCGGCCDVRRATIIVNIVNIVISLLFILEFVWLDKLIAKDEEVVGDDDEAQEELNTLVAFVKQTEGLMEGLMVLRIIGCAIGIYGAKTFEWKYVAGAVAIYAFVLIPDIAAFGLLFGPVMDILFAYPQVFLIMEMRSGIM
eukprot:CAMPEP_0194059478 /NCGR_PEP_ID=MMETSP0009_2-20130614/69167_1 /TAXON_ID=210454 /ORGANISM="Grammatophora oceanica, Strain CCMP 410" /LENGTH=159 /DNA_ID=CAMNT_0038710055 /DNA_START=61 /DNA_END=537 /DNA_ORIENTATION=+